MWSLVAGDLIAWCFDAVRSCARSLRLIFKNKFFSTCFCTKVSLSTSLWSSWFRKKEISPNSPPMRTCVALTSSALRAAKHSSGLSVAVSPALWAVMLESAGARFGVTSWELWVGGRGEGDVVYWCGRVPPGALGNGFQVAPAPEMTPTFTTAASSL